MTPEEVLGRLEGSGLIRDAEDAAVIRQALADLAWYRREYPKAYAVAQDAHALRREYEAHVCRTGCRWGRR